MTQSASFSATDLAATSENAKAVLAAAGARAEALVAAWIKAGNAAAVLEASEQAQGATRKAAKRGLNVLKSRGVTIPEKRHVASLQSEEASEEQALMLAPDPSGVVVFALYRRSTTGKTRVCFVLLRDGQGIARIENGDLSTSKIKEQLRKAFPYADYDAIPVSPAWARSRIASARKTHVARGLIEPLGFDTAEPLLTPVPAEATAHPFDEEGFEFADDDARSMTAQSASLHQQPEFRRLFPPAVEVDALLRKVGEHFTPGQSPEPDALASWIKEEVAAATDRYFTPEVRADLSGLLKDSGLSILSREGESVALQVAALIQVIGKAGLITEPPREIPFLRGYFEKAISLLAAQNRGGLPIPVPTAPEQATASAG
ncbi:MAG TPA: hypothetical protein VL137_03720 [Polyangiaceae bacterium]|nr:hypothetical protein [Polyangiaceae bacterium]